ncbi:MAG: DUF4150 domain-containing protein [Myxococcota bacterium]
MFANTQAAGMDLAFPDVCMTPSPTPTPVPYPNTAHGMTASGAVFHVLMAGAPTHNLGSSVPMTVGDNAGVQGGAVSGSVMGSSKHLTGAMTVLVGGMPVSRMSSMSSQNKGNCVGTRSTPSQLKVIILAP